MKQIIKGEQLEPAGKKRKKSSLVKKLLLREQTNSTSQLQTFPTEPAKEQEKFPSTSIASLTTTLTTVTASNYLSTFFQVLANKSKSCKRKNSSYATRAGSDSRKTSGLQMAGCSRLAKKEENYNSNHNNNNGNNNRISLSSYSLECPKMCQKQEQKERKREKEKLRAIYLIVIGIILIVSELFTCQSCLRSRSFFLPCSASQLIPEAATSSDNNNSTTSISNNQTTTTTAAPIMRLQANSSPSASSVSASGLISSSTKSSITASSTSSSSQNPINKHNVLCNSRCHCLIIEPSLLSSSSNNSKLTTTPSADIQVSSNISHSLVAFSEDYELEADEQENRSDIEADLALATELDLLDNNNNNNNTRTTIVGQSLRTNEVNKSTDSSRNSQSFYSSAQSLRKQLTNRGKALGTGPRESSLSSGPQLYAQSLYSSQAPKLSYHAHSPYLKASTSGTSNPDSLATATAPAASSSAGVHHLPSSVNNGRGQLTGAVKLLQLRALDLSEQLKVVSSNLSELQLATSISFLLHSIETHNTQSLSLSNNELQFELWSELYALLASHFRQRILRLDLSRNSLSKLGITFTGHLEHLLVAHSSVWPVTGKRGAGAGAGSLLGSGHLYMKLTHHQNNQNNQNITLHEQQNLTFSLIQQPILIRALDLSHNKIKWLINDQFRALKLIQVIKLNNNKIRYIHQHAFSGLESLRYLNLNANKLQVIYIEQFQTNYNLLSLTFRSNQLTYLRGGSFASMSNLRRLDLSQNKVTLVSNNAFLGLELLELLNCSSNKLVHVPSSALHPLTNLHRLDLSDNLITQLAPGTFFHLPVEEISLERNEQLVSIERGAFWDLPYLHKLRLNGNLALSNINSQAFVACHSLQSIETDSCPSMELSSKQLFDNITSAATARLLRHETLTIKAANRVVINSSASVILPFSSAAQNNNNNNDSQHHSTGEGKQQLTSIQNQAASLQNLASSSSYKQQSSPIMSVKHALYYLGTVTLLAIALKLVFTYTTTSRYVASRRERRRVYQLSKPADDFELTQAAGHSLVGELNMLTPPISSSSPSSPTLMSQQSTPVDFNTTSSSINDSGETFDSARLELDEQQYARSEDISVISDGTFPYQFVCCPLGCPPNSQLIEAQNSVRRDEQNPEQQLCDQSAITQSQEQELGLASQQHPTQNTVDLIHSQLVAAGFDYGHANCAHFYQSLGPALQLADMTANLVNHMDYY